MNEAETRTEHISTEITKKKEGVEKINWRRLTSCGYAAF